MQISASSVLKDGSHGFGPAGGNCNEKVAAAEAARQLLVVVQRADVAWHCSYEEVSRLAETWLARNSLSYI